jgi:threonine dehydratase
MLQRTGSFKLRGAYNKISRLPPTQQSRGVIAASAGNHAQGVAVAARLCGAPAVVVMPESAPQSKIAASRAYGAEVILHGEHFDDTIALAHQIERERGLTFIPGFDDPAVIAGQGTIGCEIVSELAEFDDVIVPVGGGGLIAGIALALRSLAPRARIFGVQAEEAPAAVASRAAGKRVRVDVGATIADGIAVARPGELPFELMQRSVDDIVTVSEDQIRTAMAEIVQRTKLVAEGAGAVALAAVLEGKLPLVGRRVVLILSGGNVDPRVLAQVIDG